MEMKAILKDVLEHFSVNYSNPYVRVHSYLFDDDSTHSTNWLLSHLDIVTLGQENTWNILSGGDYYDYDIGTK